MLNNIEIYQSENGEIEFRGDTKNIFKDEEINQNMVYANFAHTTSHRAIQGKTQTKEIIDNLYKTYKISHL